VQQIATGAYNACALMSGGTVKCWGSDDFGQLGTGTTSHPVTIAGISNVQAITVGGDLMCALKTDASMWCWGATNGAQVNVNYGPTPTQVLTGVAAMDAFYTDVCAVMTNGHVKCWGDNQAGQLGNGTTTPSN